MRTAASCTTENPVRSQPTTNITARSDARHAPNSTRLHTEGAEPATITQKTSRHQEREERRHLRLPVCKSKLTWRFSFSPRDFSLVFFELGWAHKILASVGVPRPKKIFENHFPNEASMPALQLSGHSLLAAHCAPSSRTLCCIAVAPPKEIAGASLIRFASLVWLSAVSCRC